AFKPSVAPTDYLIQDTHSSLFTNSPARYSFSFKKWEPVEYGQLKLGPPGFFIQLHHHSGLKAQIFHEKITEGRKTAIAVKQDPPTIDKKLIVHQRYTTPGSIPAALRGKLAPKKYRHRVLKSSLNHRCSKRYLCCSCTLPKLCLVVNC